MTAVTSLAMPPARARQLVGVFVLFALVPDALALLPGDSVQNAGGVVSVAVVLLLAYLIDRGSPRAWRVAVVFQVLAIAVLAFVAGETALVTVMALANLVSLAALLSGAVRAHVAR